MSEILRFNPEIQVETDHDVRQILAERLDTHLSQFNAEYVSEMLEEIAEHISIGDFDSPEVKQIILQHIERVGLRFNLAFVKELSISDNPLKQTLAYILSTELDKSDFEDWVSYVSENYRTIDKALITGSADKEILNSIRYGRGWLFEYMGESIRLRSDIEDKSVLERDYLRIIQKFIEDKYCSDSEPRKYSPVLSGGFTVSEDVVGKLSWEDFLITLKKDRVYRKSDSSLFPEEAAHINNEIQREKVHPQMDIESVDLSVAFEQLSKIGTRQSVDFLVSWLQFYPESFPSLVGRNASKIDANYAASELLPLLKHEDEKVRDAVSRALYSLEFGNIGVTEQGVEYLNKVFDLGELNNPLNAARRLTADGKVGVFDEQRRLLKFFQLQGLSNDEAIVKAKLLDVTYEMLFHGVAGEDSSIQKDREAYMDEFLRNYFNFYNNDFLQKTGVNFNDLSLFEQGQLLAYFKATTESQQDKTINFVKRFGHDGFRCFLSLEDDLAMGDKIIALGESLPVSEARAVFAKYVEVMEKIDDVESMLAETFHIKLSDNQQVIRKTKKNLMTRAKQILISAEARLSDSNNENIADTKSQLSRLDADTILFQSMFKAAYQESEESSQPLELSDVSGLVLTSKSIVSIDKTESDRMFGIFLENRTGLPVTILDKASSKFKKTLINEDAIVFILERDGDLISFLAAEPNSETRRVYLSAFNTDPALKGSAIGSAMFAQVIDGYTKNGYAVDIMVNPARIPMFKKYIEDFGFTITGVIEDYENTGETVYQLSREPFIEVTSSDKLKSAA